MRIATETVWATADGKLVPAGDDKAAFLVASKGHPMPDKKLQRFGKQADKFFKDATFDRAGTLEPHKMLPQPEPLSYARLESNAATKAQAQQGAKDDAAKAKAVEEKRAALDAGPAPENREAGLRMKTRGRKSKKR